MSSEWEEQHQHRSSSRSLDIAEVLSIRVRVHYGDYYCLSTSTNPLFHHSCGKSPHHHQANQIQNDNDNGHHSSPRGRSRQDLTYTMSSALMLELEGRLANGWGLTRHNDGGSTFIRGAHQTKSTEIRCATEARKMMSNLHNGLSHSPLTRELARAGTLGGWLPSSEHVRGRLRMD